LNDEFIIHHPGQHYSEQKLIEIIPNKKVVWLVTDSTLYWLQKDRDEWTDTKMIFEITSKGGGLVPGRECYAMCAKGWTMIIKDWLCNFISSGTPSAEMSKAAGIRNRLLED
jgi:hypothetical protein